MIEKRLNTVWAGVIIGTFFPLLTFYIIYNWLTKTLTISEFLSRLVRAELQTNIYIWALIPVFIVFGLFYHKAWDAGLKGILMPTFIYMILIVAFSF
jgi:hypothetical protein